MSCTAAAILAFSVHALPGEYNGVHPGGLVQCDRVIAGAYYNSESRVSVFAGLDIPLSGPVSIEAALVTGYTYSDVLPMARLTSKVGDSVRLFVAPSMTTKREVGVVFGVELRIGGGS